VTTELITIVEIDQPFCTRVYGDSPCTAVLGVTGAHKCYNTWATCQDKSNYSADVLTLRFFSEIENPPKPLQMLPLLRGVSDRPTELNVVGGDAGISPLGRRARVTISMADMPYHDRLVDKYWRERLSGAAQASGIGYTPTERGTFWSKWLARNPNYATLAVRVRRGTVQDAAFSLASLKTESYILDSIDGPGSGGGVTITAKDILALADNDRALAPKPAQGRIQDAISDSASAPIVATLLPAGVGAANYSASGRVRIGKEIFSFTRSGDALTLTARALSGTSAQSHKANDSAQECYFVDDSPFHAVISNLLLDYAGIDPAFIDFTEWNDEATTWLSTYNLNAVISEPTGVTKLIGEILQASISYLWWDAEAQKIRLRALRPQQTVKSVDDYSNILQSSLAQATKADERITQLVIFYDVINAAERATESSNFARARVFFPPASRAPNDVEERIKTIYTRWLDSSNDAEVLNTGTKIIQRYYKAPVKTVFMLDRADQDLKLADVIDLQHYAITDENGEPYNFPAQIIGLEHTDGGARIKITAIPYDFAGRFAYIMNNGTLDYLASSQDERQLGAWFSDNGGLMANSDPPYLIV
jgi:hypothetical protein